MFTFGSFFYASTAPPQLCNPPFETCAHRLCPDRSQDARDLCQRVIQVLKKLQKNRRMGLSEIQLTIEIEQPEEIERNKVLGIEVSLRSRDDGRLGRSAAVK